MISTKDRLRLPENTCRYMIYPTSNSACVLAKEFPGKYGLITIFDCLHDMGDPIGAIQHIGSSLEDDGTCMIVEPAAGDRLQDNLNPIGRMYYSGSTMVCVPTSMAQRSARLSCAQAGEKRLREVIVDKGGFTRFRLRRRNAVQHDLGSPALAATYFASALTNAEFASRSV